MSVNLVNEAATIQFPLVKHAEGAGWQVVSDVEASGKTFTLITAARPILEDKGHFPGATVILVVDRNELEGQLSG